MGKRYCIFAANYLPNLGGVERYTYNLANELVTKGNEVTVVTSNVFILPQEERIDKINVLRIPCWNVLAGRFPVLKYDAWFRKLNRELCNREFDFVIVQTRFYLHSFYAVRFAKKKRLPCIVIEHGTNHFTVNNCVLDAAGHIYEHMISALVKSNCQQFYGVSNDCCRWLQHFGITANGVLYNAVNLADINEKLQHPAEDYRKKFSLGNRIIVTYAGRLVREKGILKLLEAVKTVRASGVDVILMIAGDGDLYQEINQANIPYAHLLGRLDFEHVISLLGDTDIFCLPTDYPEGFPTSVLEAAACRCYIVTTTNGGSKELLLDADYGMVLSENTADNIANAISYAATNYEYRDKAVGRTYNRLQNMFTWEKTASKIIELAEGDYHEQ